MLDITFPDVPDDIDANAAYAIQASVVDGVFGKKIVGYKAGLTNSTVQRQFGVTQPVFGVLPDVARLGPKVSLPHVPGLKIEVEIGFLVGIGDEPAAMLAVIELPRLAYADMKKVSLADIIATNVSAYRFITGPTGCSTPMSANIRFRSNATARNCSRRLRATRTVIPTTSTAGWSRVSASSATGSSRA